MSKQYPPEICVDQNVYETYFAGIFSFAISQVTNLVALRFKLNDVQLYEEFLADLSLREPLADK